MRAFVLLRLASTDGELRARRALADLDKRITPEQRQAALSGAEDWVPRLDDCLPASLGDVDGRVAVEQMGLGRSAGGPHATVCEDVEKRRLSLPDDRLRVAPR